MKKTTQEQQVIEVLRKAGGYATLRRLNELVDFSAWATKTPEASVRRGTLTCPRCPCIVACLPMCATDKTLNPKYVLRHGQRGLTSAKVVLFPQTAKRIIKYCDFPRGFEGFSRKMCNFVAK